MWPQFTHCSSFKGVAGRAFELAAVRFAALNIGVVKVHVNAVKYTSFLRLSPLTGISCIWWRSPVGFSLESRCTLGSGGRALYQTGASPAGPRACHWGGWQWLPLLPLPQNVNTPSSEGRGWRRPIEPSEDGGSEERMGGGWWWEGGAFSSQSHLSFAGSSTGMNGGHAPSPQRPPNT